MIKWQETNTRYHGGVVSVMSDQYVYQKEFKRLSGRTELLEGIQGDGEVLLMKRRRTLGVAYTYEGLKSTLEASAEKLTSRLEKRRKFFKQLGHRFYRE